MVFHPSRRQRVSPFCLCCSPAKTTANEPFSIRSSIPIGDNHKFFPFDRAAISSLVFALPEKHHITSHFQVIENTAPEFRYSQSKLLTKIQKKRNVIEEASKSTFNTIVVFLEMIPSNCTFSSLSGRLFLRPENTPEPRNTDLGRDIGNEEKGECVESFSLIARTVQYPLIR
jgi:hypothetical protein